MGAWLQFSFLEIKLTRTSGVCVTSPDSDTRSNYSFLNIFGVFAINVSWIRKYTGVENLWIKRIFMATFPGKVLVLAQKNFKISYAISYMFLSYWCIDRLLHNEQYKNVQRKVLRKQTNKIENESESYSAKILRSVFFSHCVFYTTHGCIYCKSWPTMLYS